MRRDAFLFAGNYVTSSRFCMSSFVTQWRRRDLAAPCHTLALASHELGEVDIDQPLKASKKEVPGFLVLGGIHKFARSELRSPSCEVAEGSDPFSSCLVRGRLDLFAVNGVFWLQK